MQISIDDFFEAMRGTARPRVIAAVRAELEIDGSPLRRSLQGMEAWAKAKIPTVERRDPRPMLPEGSDCENPTTTVSFGPKRRSCRERALVAPIVEDYLAYRDGTASQATVARVAAALADPASELCRTLVRVSKPNAERGNQF